MLEVGDAAEIAVRFSLGDAATLSGPVARGEVGQVWRLSTTSGTFAVKEPFEPIPLDEVREHADYQEAAHAAGIPAPAVLRADDGDAFAELAGALVRVFEWVDLLERDANVDPAQVGRIVASIHRLDFRGHLPNDPWYTDAIGGDRWDTLIDALHANGAPFAERLSGMRDELVALEGLMEEPRELQTCHRDLWADNVLRTTAGGLCVIDWENCGLADPSQELALVVFEFAMGNPQRARALYRAYLEAGGTGRIDRPGNFSMLVAQLGHIGEDACTRWLDPGEAERDRQEAGAEQFIRWLDLGEIEAERERQEARVEEFVKLPLTRKAIDRLLIATTS